MQKWLINHLAGNKLRDFVFEGSEYELEKFMNKEFSCGCEDCRGLPFFSTYEACEWGIEDVTDEGDEYE